MHTDVCIGIAAYMQFVNFIQDSIAIYLSENTENKTFNILTENKIIRDIPNWVKYSGISKI